MLCDTETYTFAFNYNVGPRFARRLRALLISNFNYDVTEVDVYKENVEINAEEISDQRRFALDCYIQGVLDGSSNWKA